MQTIAMTNQKGGVGKTDETRNLAAALAELGYNVLVIDLDPQGHLTEACGLEEAPDDFNLARALVTDDDLTADRIRSLTVQWIERVDVIPTNLRMFLAERELYHHRGAEYRLATLLEAFADTHDVCLIDCPPSLGIVTDNALVAAGQVIIPVQAEDSTLRALRLLMMQIASIRKQLRTEVDIIGMIVGMYDARRGVAVTSTYEALKGMPFPILATVPDRAAIREAWRAGQSVIAYAPSSDAAQVYRDLAKSLVSDGDSA